MSKGYVQYHYTTWHTGEEHGTVTCMDVDIIQHSIEERIAQRRLARSQYADLKVVHDKWVDCGIPVPQLLKDLMREFTEKF